MDCGGRAGSHRLALSSVYSFHSESANHAVLSDLALLLLTQLALERTEVLLCILRMFSSEPQAEFNESVDAYKDRVYWTGDAENDGLPAFLPIVSTARHQGALRIHAMLRMLTRFDLEITAGFGIGFSVQICSPISRKSTIAGGIRVPTRSKRTTISSRYSSEIGF